MKIEEYRERVNVIADLNQVIGNLIGVKEYVEMEEHKKMCSEMINRLQRIHAFLLVEFFEVCVDNNSGKIVAQIDLERDKNV